MKIFKENDYRKILQNRISDFKNKDSQKFSLLKIAKYCKIQSSYLTKILKSESHLNEDQLYLILDYLKFNENELLFITLLHRYQRSSLAPRKKKIETEIKKIKSKYLATEKHLKATLIKDESSFSTQYFLTPQLQIIHLLLSIPAFKNNYKLISKYLNISEEQFDYFIKTLEEMKLIKVEHTKVEILNNHLFLSKNSVLISAYHNLMKTNSINRINSLSTNEKYGLSVLFNSDKHAFDQIRIKIINLITELEKDIREKEEYSEVYQLSIDFFPWT